MFLVGLTGGIATGKSTVSKAFADLHIPIIDADAIAAEVVEPGKPAWKLLKDAFGDEYFDDDGHLKRRLLGRFVFTNDDARRKLNKITHPNIQKEMLKQIILTALRGHQFAILDVPLLFESGIDKYCWKTIVVYCTEEQQLERLINRNEYSEEEALDRISSQMSMEKKCKLASLVIDNSGSLQETEDRIKILLYDSLKTSKFHWFVRFLLLIVIGSCGAFLFWIFYKLL